MPILKRKPPYQSAKDYGNRLVTLLSCGTYKQIQEGTEEYIEDARKRGFKPEGIQAGLVTVHSVAIQHLREGGYICPDGRRPQPMR